MSCSHPEAPRTHLHFNATILYSRDQTVMCSSPMYTAPSGLAQSCALLWQALLQIPGSIARCLDLNSQMFEDVARVVDFLSANQSNRLAALSKDGIFLRIEKPNQIHLCARSLDRAQDIVQTKPAMPVGAVGDDEEKRAEGNAPGQNDRGPANHPNRKGWSPPYLSESFLTSFQSVVGLRRSPEVE